MRAVELDAVERAVRAVEDPEIPITLADLGVLRSIQVDDGRVRVLLRPTRLGCPARDRMEADVREAIREIAHDAVVEVIWEMVGWTEDAVTAEGWRILNDIGYARMGGNPDEVACPYCGGIHVQGAGQFGGALCKSPFTCRSCGSTFDVLRSATPVANPTRKELL
ncbi:MAG: iron-sulfur cluster assembly protein [Solirubrobacterales bacterium]